VDAEELGRNSANGAPADGDGDAGDVAAGGAGQFLGPVTLMSSRRSWPFATSSTRPTPGA
jgi:hypothetical protein